MGEIMMSKSKVLDDVIELLIKEAIKQIENDKQDENRGIL
jgi:hypothetical protein